MIQPQATEHLKNSNAKVFCLCFLKDYHSFTSQGRDYVKRIEVSEKVEENGGHGYLIYEKSPVPLGIIRICLIL